MQQRGAPVASLAELDDLRELVDLPGPFLTVYLPLGPANEELAEATALRWRELRHRAEAGGAPARLLDRVEPEIEAARRGAAGLCVVAAEDGPVHVERLDAAPAELSAWKAAPVLAPLVAARQRRQPHVVALIDRRGADITAHVPGNGERSRSVEVEGEEPPLRKVAAGGWSQRRFQQRAEETWQRNMADVAGELSAMADGCDARVVAVGGDERAVGLLLGDLPSTVRDRVAPIEVTRAADGSVDHLGDEVDRVLDAWVDERLHEGLATYRQELGQHDRATAGSTETAAALRMARVATLLVPASRGDDADTSAAVVDALDTGAAIQVLPEATGLDALGAILRW